MLYLLLSAMGLGFMLSLVFIGPVFFLLIETSFTRGPKHALSLDFGVITADIICIVLAYFCSNQVIEMIDSHPIFYQITSLIIFMYAIYMLFAKTKMHAPKEKKLINQNYFRTFINGFLFNILNIGVVLFWLITVITVRRSYPDTKDFMLYISLVILTYLAIDLFKIYLAKQFHDRLSDTLARKIKKIVAVIFLFFSVFIFLQSYKQFNQLDKNLEKNGIDKHNIGQTHTK